MCAFRNFLQEDIDRGEIARIVGTVTRDGETWTIVDVLASESTDGDCFRAYPSPAYAETTGTICNTANTLADLYRDLSR